MQEAIVFTLPCENSDEKYVERPNYHSLQASPIGTYGNEEQEMGESGELVEIKEFSLGCYEAQIKILRASAAICRICLQKSLEELICPCFCKESKMHVHKSCLDSWLLTLSAKNQEFMACEICRIRYDIEFKYKFQFELSSSLG